MKIRLEFRYSVLNNFNRMKTDLNVKIRTDSFCIREAFGDLVVSIPSEKWICHK